MEHKDYKEMLLVHALGALDEVEARALEAHLATCDECRAELEPWVETAAALVFSVEPVAPSAGLRERLLESARQLPQSATGRMKGETGPAVNNARESSSSESSSSEAPASSTTQNVLPFTRPARRKWTTSSVAVTLAASLAFVALLAALFVIWNRNQEMRAEMARLSNRLDQTQEELTRVREEREMLASPEARTAMLAGTNMAPRAHARLAIDQSTGRAVFIVNDLPPAPAGKAYQLWFIADGKPLPGGVFAPNAQGHADMRDQVPAAGRQATIFAVTLEPQGGMSAPTGEKYLLSATS